MGLLGLGVQSCARLPDGTPRTGRVLLWSVKELCTVRGADGVNYKHTYRHGQAQFVIALIADDKKTTAPTGGL